jgi:hypothetical protein
VRIAPLIVVVIQNKFLHFWSGQDPCRYIRQHSKRGWDRSRGQLAAGEAKIVEKPLRSLARAVALLVCAISTSANAQPGNGVTAGELHVEPPTLENIGIEWRIVGDENHNAAVDVKFRLKSETKWHQGLPLLEVMGKRETTPVTTGLFANAITVVSPNMFAGSIFDLKPDTAYEVKLVLSDPDGVSGSVERTVTIRTRPEPMPAEGGKVYHVYPFGFKGSRQEPSFDGLLAAYYEGSIGGDWYNVYKPRVRPGDIILVHAGVYKDDRWHYSHEIRTTPPNSECCKTTGDGTYYLYAKGEPNKPIVIKAAGDGEVIFDGDGNNNLFNVMAADYNYFEGLTFRNTFITFEAGLKKIAGAKGITIKHSKFIDIGVGIHTDFSGSGNFYIADNEFTGRNNSTYFIGWDSPWWRKLPEYQEGSRMLSQYAVKVYGPGNVIAYNKVRNFHDGIDNATYGDPDDAYGLQPSSIDIYNNDISNMHDNCVEADGSLHNIRVMRNLCTNIGEHALSLQPNIGGPAYFIRNVVYNNRTGAKLWDPSSGAIYYNNTWFSGFHPGGARTANIHLRNNLFLRQDLGAPVLQVSTSTPYSSSDYNGFFAGEGAAPFQWSVVQGAVSANASPVPTFKTLKEYARATGQDRHSIMIDYSAFMDVKPVDRGAPITTLYDGGKLDFRLSPNSPAIDRGVVIPNITDGYVGKEPDLGALEQGQPVPHYGPRPVN